jgi:hypothetical protein
MKVNHLGLAQFFMGGVIVFSLQIGVLAMKQAPHDGSSDESGCCCACWRTFWPWCKNCCADMEEDVVDIGQGIAQVAADLEKFKQEHPEAYAFLLEMAEGKPVEQAAFDSFKTEFTQLGILGADGKVQPELLTLVNTLLSKQE